MEYLYDWVLIYQDESQVYLFADGIAESEIAQMTLLRNRLAPTVF